MANPVVSNMHEAAKRICDHHVNKKKPITIEHLALLHDKLIKSETNLTKMRTFNICLLGFCGFMRAH